MSELPGAVGQEIGAVRHLPQQLRCDLHLGAQFRQPGGQATLLDEGGQSGRKLDEEELDDLSAESEAPCEAASETAAEGPDGTPPETDAGENGEA